MAGNNPDSFQECLEGNVSDPIEYSRQLSKEIKRVEDIANQAGGNPNPDDHMLFQDDGSYDIGTKDGGVTNDRPRNVVMKGSTIIGDNPVFFSDLENDLTGVARENGFLYAGTSPDSVTFYGTSVTSGIGGVMGFCRDAVATGGIKWTYFYYPNLSDLALGSSVYESSATTLMDLLLVMNRIPTQIFIRRFRFGEDGALTLGYQASQGAGPNTGGRLKNAKTADFTHQAAPPAAPFAGTALYADSAGDLKTIDSSSVAGGVLMLDKDLLACLTSLTTVARDAITPAPADGKMFYNSDLAAPQVRSGGTWKTFTIV